MSIFTLLERGAKRCDGRPFAVFDGVETSYAQALGLAQRIAAALGTAGFGPGSHAAVLSPNDPVAFTAAFGIFGAGMAYVPANPHNPAPAIASALNLVDVRVLFYHSAMAAVVAEIRDSLPKVALFVALGTPCSGDPTLEQFIAGHEAQPPRALAALTDAAYVGQTGGTTGEPKGVLLSHRAVFAFVEKYLAEMPHPAPVLLAATPLTHAAGMLAMPIVAQGGTIVMMARPDLPRFIDLIAEQRVTTTFLPPTVIYRLLDLPGAETRDFSSLRHFIYGAAPMSVSRLKQALTLFGPVMAQCYGQTECHSFITFMRPEDHFVDGRLADDARLSACGRPSIGTRVVIKGDDGAILPDGIPGEICVQSDLAMTGYYRNDSATAEVLRDGLIHTGDIGFVDGDGFLHIVDRKKDLIITGGFNVYPAEVEQVVNSHPTVADCGVIGLSDADWGEAVTVVVELKPGAAVSEQDLIDYCRPRLGGVKTPKHVFFWPELPRSPVGKVLRKEIRARISVPV
ncbi:long-chain fatty acid--CoA ligase [Sphingorhabdus pulchriflava]|uniref:Long-chain fatty acid--CoA ligase n=1 Tax=Sphingorhabdus pulchriflava TaxID=2292257 RepID=A0A371B4H8_9SPHN|nr:AMP-binding protein [Sphingorhabdus pulchriflava]RDV02460.1 long-chain fatty acid--CoA ligase [Sphingorhabdus pulchriflava]